MTRRYAGFLGFFGGGCCGLCRRDHDRPLAGARCAYDSRVRKTITETYGRRPCSVASFPLHGADSSPSSPTPTRRSRPGALRSSRFLRSPRTGCFCSTASRERRRGPRRANARLAKANLSFATALVATLDARDRYTAGHSAAVAIYASTSPGEWGSQSMSRNSCTSADSFTTSARSGFRRGFSRSPERSRSMSDVRWSSTRRSASGSSETSTTTRDRRDRPPPSRARRRQRLPGWTSRRRDSASCSDHRRRRRVQRDDVGSPVPGRDAESRRALRLAQAVESQFDTAVVAAFEAVLTGADEAYRMGTRADFVFEGVGPRAPEPVPLSAPLR